jgi:hypothetical protein
MPTAAFLAGKAAVYRAFLEELTPVTLTLYETGVLHMAPAAPQRRTRKVAPAAAPVDDAGLPQDTPPEIPSALANPNRRKAAARRVQAATGEEKVRMPQAKRAGETKDGVIVAPIKGKYFKLADSIGLMPLMEWAASSDEVDGRNASQILGLYRVLQDIVHEDDWAEFKQFCREAKAIDQDFIDFQNAAMEAIAARPTQEPAAS